MKFIIISFIYILFYIYHKTNKQVEENIQTKRKRTNTNNLSLIQRTLN